MKPGDLVGWHRVNNEAQDEIILEKGIVISIETADAWGPRRVQVLFEGGDLEWMLKSSLEVISESR